jgi:hypothetical protein
MESTLSIIATIISSFALIGVVVGLLLQNRQLRASHTQVVREMHLELVKMTIENPELATSVYKGSSAKDFAAHTLINFQATLWLTAYTLKDVSKASLAQQVASLFEGEQARIWWGYARKYYEMDLSSKRGRDFFAIMDNEFNKALTELTSDGQPGTVSSSE